MTAMPASTETQPSNKIAALNDSFRRTFVGGAVMITSGVESLSIAKRSRLLAAVRAFDAFEFGNDPYAEHDFGSIDLEGERYFWKIDCYDLRMTHHSPDPTNPAVTRRVLTVMQASEY